MQENLYAALELSKILHMLADQTACDDSRAMALAITPSWDYASAQTLLQQTADANALSARYGYPSVYGIVNCGQPLAKAARGGRLTTTELLGIARTLKAIRLLDNWKRQSSAQNTGLDNIFRFLTPNSLLEEEIFTAIESEDFIADRASPKLADIRRKITATGLRIRVQLDKLIKSATYSKYLQEQLVTQRDGRFVVPVKAECKNEIKGLVHDTSSSGATLFIEPMAVVEANNEIRVLQNEEQQEIDRILQQLSAAAGACAEEIIQSYDLCIMVDIIFAKSKLADKMKACNPTLTNDGIINLKKARHPLIPKEVVVPVDIHLGASFDTLVITGPNTGGKTVALKTLGLMTLMAMCGLMLPVAEGSSLSVFSHVLADIGDEQSIEQSLSTFSSHIANLVKIIAKADNRSLVLMDELGAGTDPVEGAALAVAIIERLRGVGAKIAATTHYPEIKLYALQTTGVENGSCEFNVETLSPTYRLLIGIPGRSNAFAISARLGLEEAIIEAAKDLVSGENTRFEDVVTQLEATRRDLENQRTAVQQLQEEATALRRQALDEQAAAQKSIEKQLQQATDQARTVVERTKSQTALLINELEDLKKQRDKEDFSALAGKAGAAYKGRIRDLEETANPVLGVREENYVLPRALKAGDKVLIADLGIGAIVISGPDTSGNYLLHAGILKTTVHQSNLRLQEQESKVTVNNRSTTRTVAAKVASKVERDVHTELDIRGMAADEGIMELDRFIDNCLLMGLKTVTIIHGKGTGVLRTAVQQRLRTMKKSVSTYRSGAYGEGEHGVTIVELK